MSENLFDKLENQARKDPKIICFPETGNEMILQAAEQCVVRKIGKPMLIGNEQIIREFAASIGTSVDGCSFFDNTDDNTRAQLASKYIETSSIFSEKAIIRKSKDNVNCAMILEGLGIVDCCAAGRVYTTADVILAAQTFVGLAEGFGVISSVGILNVPNYDGPEGNMLVIGDCAINAAPDANDLADIAIASADTANTLLGWDPRVAMLSFSTLGSTEHESIEPVRESIEIVKSRRPDVKIDGEFQLDTAINPKSAASKVKRESDVAGKANVLIFPNLGAGNIGVKLIQTFGKADAYGPVLQGFAKPVCDFSRSAPLSEIMGNVIMLLVRAQLGK